MVTPSENHRSLARPTGLTGAGRAPVTIPAMILAALALVGSVIGLLAEGGPGRQVVRTYRGAEVVLYGEGLYAADAWL